MSQITWILSHFTWSAGIDLGLVALLTYGLLRLIEGTRAVQLLRGMILLIIAAALISLFSPFPVLNWIIRTVMPALVVAIPVIFQPELRRGLERLGRATQFTNLPIAGRAGINRPLSEILAACQRLSDLHLGGLIAVARDTGLQDIADSGVALDADVTAELLVTIFYLGSPLHDGGVIVSSNRIVAARCVLPLTESLRARGLGTRHRAALSVSEQTDAVCFVVSEETGSISVAVNGTLHRRLGPQALETLVMGLYEGTRVRALRFRRRKRGPVRTLETHTHAQ
ncbi:MAG: diadenylate cyclase CdaA [Chloroflexota bacterium]